jgi:hypothetical protein
MRTILSNERGQAASWRFEGDVDVAAAVRYSRADQPGTAADSGDFAELDRDRNGCWPHEPESFRASFPEDRRNDANGFPQRIASPHFQKYKVGTEHMVKALELVEVDPILLGEKSEVN